MTKYTASTQIYTLSLHDALPIFTSLKWLETNNLFNNLIQRNQSAAFSSGKVRPNHETNINIIARRTRKDVNSHTVLDGIITTIMATIQRINIIGSREGSRNRRRLKRSEERFSRNAETDLVCRLLLEKKKPSLHLTRLPRQFGLCLAQCQILRSPDNTDQ